MIVLVVMPTSVYVRGVGIGVCVGVCFGDVYVCKIGRAPNFPEKR